MTSIVGYARRRGARFLTLRHYRSGRGKPVVGDNGVEPPFFLRCAVQRFLAAGRAERVITPFHQHELVGLPHDGIVFDNQNAAVGVVDRRRR